MSEKEQMADKIIRVMAIIFILVLLYANATSVIYAFKNPEKTKTQIFLHLPKHILLDFSKGNSND